MAVRRVRTCLKLAIACAAVLTLLAWYYSSMPHASSSNPLPSSEPDRKPRHYRTAKEKAERLDRQYLRRLIHQSGNPDSAHQLLEFEDNAQSSNYTATIVMGRMNDDAEGVQWVYDKLLNIDDHQIYIVDDPNSTFPHLERNHGREAAVYLKYIIDHYDNLNDITFFWHNEEVVWHNNILLSASSVKSINRMDRENIMRSGFVPSRCDHWPGCPTWIRFNPSKAEHRLDPHRLEDMYNPELFTQFFPDIIDFPPFFAGTCCSQFAVARNTIRSRSVESYQTILDWILGYERDDRSGMVLEYMWHYIFLGRGTLCPSMQECYCKTYNFCLEDAKQIEQLESWNAFRTRREEVKWQVQFIEDARDTQQRLKEAEGAKPAAVLAIEEAYNVELDRLGVELDRLENATWASRETIIKHWRLPPPPVGW